MMKTLATTAILLACNEITRGYVFPGLSLRSPALSSALAMSKTKVLNEVKQRYDGRFDLLSMVEEEDDEVANHDLFLEADAEEVDPPSVGQLVKGTVVDMDDNGALIETGGKMSSYLPLAEASLSAIKHVQQVLTMGQEITAEVIGSLRGMPVVSLRNAELEQAWDTVFRTRAADEVFEVIVLEVNKGGAVCEAFGLKAFLPGSHVVGVPDESMVGTRIKVKFLDVIEEEGKLVLSQRRAQSSTVLQRGSVVNAIVTGLRDYGVFAEIEGGGTALLHISQISYERIENLEKVFTIGQKIKAMVIEYDKLNGKVALSTRTLEPSPGDMLRDMEGVFQNAEQSAMRYHERLEAERLAREAAAKDIVAGLGGALSGNENADPLVSVAESIESILASIVGETKDANKGASV